MTYNFVLDVDGVLTSGNFMYSSEGKLYKEFGPHDSYSLNKIKDKVSIHFISADSRGFNITKARISDMGFEVSLVPEDERFNFIKENYGFENLIFMGDGDADAEVLDKAFFGIAPKNARPDALKFANYITSNIGGQGAVAEACDIIANQILKT